MKTAAFILTALLSGPRLWADGAPQAAPAPGLGGMFIPLVAIMGLFYLLLIRPQQKQQKEQQKMIDALKRGDRVLTQGGLYATVSAVKGKVLEVKLNDEVKVLLAKSGVSQVVSEDPTQESEPAAASADKK